MKIRTKDGIELDYGVQGRGAPLILVHGLALGSQIWREQINSFSHHFQVVTYDLRGHGKSAKPQIDSAYSDETFVSDLLCLYEHLKLRTAYLCGISLGGQIALRFAISYPQKVVGPT